LQLEKIFWQLIKFLSSLKIFLKNFLGGNYFLPVGQFLAFNLF